MALRRAQSQARSLCQPGFGVLNDMVPSRHRAGCPAQGTDVGAPDYVSQIVLAVVAADWAGRRYAVLADRIRHRAAT